MEIEDLKTLIAVYSELRSRVPSDCVEVLDKHFSRLLKDLKDLGVQNALKKWNIDDEEVEVMVDI